jgi:hypothetical protein
VSLYAAPECHESCLHFSLDPTKEKRDEQWVCTKRRRRGKRATRERGYDAKDKGSHEKTQTRARARKQKGRREKLPFFALSLLLTHCFLSLSLFTRRDVPMLVAALTCP